MGADACAVQDDGTVVGTDIRNRARLLPVTDLLSQHTVFWDAGRSLRS